MVSMLVYAVLHTLMQVLRSTCIKLHALPTQCCVLQRTHSFVIIWLYCMWTSPERGVYAPRQQQ